MQNNYLIPANTKKSMLWLGFFRPIDAIILGVGLSISFILLLLMNSMSIGLAIIIMIPGLVSAFLVMPVPHYHNVLQLLTNIINFYTNRRKYYWKGWNMYEEFTRNGK